jgi:hypothetical protein
MKTILELITTLIVTIYGFPAASYGSADYIYFNSFDEMYARADVILICTAETTSFKNLDIDSSPDGESYYVYTVSTVKADTVIKGDIKPGEKLEVKQLGGFYDNVYHFSDNTDYLTVGSQYLLFLSIYEDSPASLLNQTQAMYYVSGTRITPRDGNEITITIEDLITE